MKAQKENSTRRLFRSEGNKVIGGVSSGLGEYFQIDPTIIRIIFILLIFFGGSGIFIYLILWAVVPSESDTKKQSTDAIMSNFEDMKQSARSMADKIKSNPENKNQSFLAIILVLLGALFLFDNFNLINLDIGRLWPILLIILGILLLRRRV